MTRENDARDFYSKATIEWLPASLQHIWLDNPIDALIVLHRLEKSSWRSITVKFH